MDLEATQAISLDFEEEEEEEEVASMTPVAHLKVLSQKDLKETLYPIYKGSNSIGRSDTVEINIPCKSLSKDHACIEVEGEMHFIYDKGSRNKTKRHKMFLKPNVRYELKNDDALIFADLKCVYLRPKVTPKRLSETEDEAAVVKLDEPVMSVKRGLLASESYVFEEDEDTNSDSCGRSSDIIQPTQPFHADGSGPVVKSPKRVCFADDSIIEDESFKVSVAETPAAKCKKTASFYHTSEVSADYIPESDCDDEGDRSKDSVSPVFISTPQSADRRKQIQEMETQCYVADLGSGAKKTVCYDSDATTDDEGTQGFDIQDADEAKEMEKKLEEEEEEEYSMLTGATQAFNSQAAHAFANLSTLENDFEFEESEENHKPGLQDLETQVFDGPLDTQKSGTGCDDATQVMGDNDATKVIGDNMATQVIGDNEATQVMGDNEATQVMGDNEATQVMGDNEATQVMGDNEATQVMGDNEATQVMGDNEATHVMGDNEATQVMGDNEATQVMGDNEATQVIGDNEATQVIGDNETIPVMGDNEATQVIGDNEATQVMGDNEATQVMGDSEATQVMGDNEATQVMGDNEATQVIGDSEATQVMGDNEATQVMGDSEATQVMGDSEATQVMGDNEVMDGNLNEDAHDMSDSDDSVDMLVVNKSALFAIPSSATTPSAGSSDRNFEATQVIGDNDEDSLELDRSALFIIPTSSSTPSAGCSTRNIEATQVMSDIEATQVMGDTDDPEDSLEIDKAALFAIPASASTPVSQSSARNFEETQVFGDDDREAIPILKTNVKPVVPKKKPVKRMTRRSKMQETAETQVFADDSVDTIEVDIAPVKPKRKRVAAPSEDESFHLKMDITDASVNSNHSKTEGGASYNFDLCAATQVFQEDDSDDSGELKLNNSVPRDSPEKFGRTSAVFGRVYSRPKGSRTKSLSPSKQEMESPAAAPSAQPSVSRASRRKSSAVASEAASSKAKKPRRSAASKTKTTEAEESADGAVKQSRISAAKEEVKKGRESLPAPAKKAQRNTRRSLAVVEAVVTEEPVAAPLRGRRGRNAKKTEVEKVEKEEMTIERPKRGMRSAGSGSVDPPHRTRSTSSSAERSNLSRRAVTPSPQKSGRAMKEANLPEESAERNLKAPSEAEAVVPPKRGRRGRKAKGAELEGVASSPKEEEVVPPPKSARGRRAKEPQSCSSTPPDAHQKAAQRRGRGRTKATDVAALVPKEEEKDEDTVPARRARGRKTKESQESLPASKEETTRSKGKRSKVTDESTVADDSAASTPVKKGRGKRIVEPSESVSSSPASSLRNRSHVIKPKIMFTGLLDEKAEKAVVKLGGEVVDSIFKCTHLVCDQVRRTVKFLCGVSRGLVIVRPDWLHQSEEQGVFQDPVTYFVRDASAEKKFKFRLTESVERANQKGMLKGHKCFITANVKPEPKQMADIIKCSGGQLLKSMPKTSSGHTVVISCEDDEAICQPALLAGIPVVSAEFLLTGILRQEVDFELHKIFKEVHPRRSSSRR